jgi:redox-sensing transcriptional repressor
MNLSKLPEKTVERLSEYRRTLLNCLSEGKTHIYSHELALMQHITAVQVRRDIMFIGYSSMQRKGYDVQELIEVIGNIIDADQPLNVAVIGIGNLGRAVTHYFMGKRSKLNIIAAFDVDINKTDRVISGVKCYPMQKLQDIVGELDISIAILTVPSDTAIETTEKLVLSGLKEYSTLLLYRLMSLQMFI